MFAVGYIENVDDELMMFIAVDHSVFGNAEFPFTFKFTLERLSNFGIKRKLGFEGRDDTTLVLGGDFVKILLGSSGKKDAVHFRVLILS